MNKKWLNKVVSILIKASLRKDGMIDNSRVERLVKTLTLLPYPKSVIILAEYQKRLEQVLHYTPQTPSISQPLISLEPLLPGGTKIKIGSMVYNSTTRHYLLKLEEEIHE